MLKISTKLKRIIAFVVAVLFMGLMLSGVLIEVSNADNTAKKQEIKNEIKDIEEKRDSVMEELKVLDEQMVVLEGEIDEVNEEISGYESQIAVAQTELEDATVKLNNQYETYKTRVRVMYENSSIGYIDILLSAESISDFFEKLEIVTQIAEYDKNLLDNLKAEQQKIQDKKDELEGLKNELEGSKAVLVGKKSDLDSKMAESDAIVKKLESSKSALEKELKQIEAEEARTRAQIASLSGGGSYTGGSMLWPTPSCRIITSHYGWRLHPTLGYEKLHTGIDIGAGHGAKIIAAQSGTVIKATYNVAYGNYVVVDHGGGVCTLYAHQSSMAVSVGQRVNAGDTIGYVGSTGYSTGPHLHFEVIINGATTDPLGYIS